MPTYSKASSEIHTMVKAIIAQHHPELRDAGVTIDVLVALAKRNKDGGKIGFAVSRYGHPCAAQVRVNPLRKRALGLADAEITIDGDEWTDWSETRRLAILDHELTHLQVRPGPEGEKFKTDDLRRPCLYCKPDDWYINGFRSIVDRYGEEAMEFETIRAFVDSHGQYCFGFAQPKATKNQRRRAS